jgi:hypothetical protein
VKLVRLPRAVWSEIWALGGRPHGCACSYHTTNYMCTHTCAPQ